MKKEFFQCEVQLLNGTLKMFQFPNDLQPAMRTLKRDEGRNAVERMMTGALINVPKKHRYVNGDYRPILEVGRIERIITSKKKIRNRTRGQFLTDDRMSISNDIKFMLHDHSLTNKIRIAICMIVWKMKFKLRRMK